jgi:hypothetical protein
MINVVEVEFLVTCSRIAGYFKPMHDVIMLAVPTDHFEFAYLQSFSASSLNPNKVFQNGLSFTHSLERSITSSLQMRFSPCIRLLDF